MMQSAQPDCGSTCRPRALMGENPGWGLLPYSLRLGQCSPPGAICLHARRVAMAGDIWDVMAGEGVLASIG